MLCGVTPGDLAPLASLPSPGRTDVRCVDRQARPLPSFGVHVVHVEVTVAAPTPLVRGEERTVTLTLRSPLPVPDRIRVTAGEHTRIVPGPRSGNDFSVTVRPSAVAPDDLVLSVAFVDGAKTIPIGSTSLDVVDPPWNDDRELTPVRPRRAPRPPAVDAFGLVPWLAALPLREHTRRGTTAWTGILGAAEPDAGSAQWRLAVGASAQVFREPLRVGLAFATDLSGEHGALARRGHGDLRLAASWLVVETEAVAIALEASGFAPTGSGEERLGHGFLDPSVDASTDVGSFRLRTRQGALIDVDGHAKLWGSAYGLDYRTSPRLTVTAELDASLGELEHTGHAGLAGAIALTSRFGPITPTVGLRLALTDDARTSLGPWALVLMIRGEGGGDR
jgi:hypothetical protein